MVKVEQNWRHKSEKHLFDIDLYVSESEREPLEHLDLRVYPFGIGIGGAVVKVVQQILLPAL